MPVGPCALKTQKTPSARYHEPSHIPGHPLGETGAHIRYNRLLTNTSVMHAEEVVAAVDPPSHLQVKKNCIHFARLVIGATMTPDIATNLCESVQPRPLSIPCSTMPARPANVDVVDGTPCRRLTPYRHLVFQK
jgi:hypothetical protein